MGRLGRVAAGVGIVSASAVAMAPPSRAASCPPDRPLCWLLSTPTTTPTPAPAPAQVVTIPTLPPVTIAPPPPAAPHSVPEAARRLLDLVNGERAKAGLGLLNSRDDVVAIALAHSQRMVAAGNIFHNDDYFSATVQKLLNTKARGENVAQNSSVDDTHTRLMNSPGHRANILDPRFSVVGFAVVQASDGRYYTTQDFLQPAGGIAPVAPAPKPAAPRPAAVAAAVAAPPEVLAPTTTTVPPPAVEAAPEPVVEMGSLAGLTSGRPSPAASNGTGPTARLASNAWLPAGALLALVALGLAPVGRRTGWRRSSVR